MEQPRHLATLVRLSFYSSQLVDWISPPSRNQFRSGDDDSDGDDVGGGGDEKRGKWLSHWLISADGGGVECWKRRWRDNAATSSELIGSLKLDNIWFLYSWIWSSFGLWLSWTKIQTLPNLRLPISSEAHGWNNGSPSLLFQEVETLIHKIVP